MTAPPNPPPQQPVPPTAPAAAASSSPTPAPALPPVPVLPIPGFDQWGNLDAGGQQGGGSLEAVRFTTLADIRIGLVDAFQTSTTRLDIWNGWMRHIAEVSSFNIPFSMLVDGSFTSRKHNPNDVDLCYLVDAKGLSALAGAEAVRFASLFDTANAKATFLCDPYLVPMHTVGSLRMQDTVRHMAYWTQVFGEDRNRRRKCILMVDA